MMNLSESYQSLVDTQKIESDGFQVEALSMLQDIADQLQKPPQKFWQGFGRAQAKNQGLYLWGGVGRGKTWVMDFFYQHLEIDKKRRVHFHAFMQEIQDKLASHNHEKNPMEVIAKQLAQEIKVLCLDEFIVDDIGDAMILATLLQSLFSEGVVLITTSNIPPDKLYRYGLQRERFLPAIAAIQQHMKVFFLNHESDYRMQTTQRHAGSLAEAFTRFSTGETKNKVMLRSQNISFLHATPPVLWVKFNQLCDAALGKNEYLELSKQYDYILLEDAYPMNEWQNDKAKRFVTLVDVFYDRKQWIVLSPEVEIDTLYEGTQLAFDFKRVASRLHEMRRTINEGH